MVARQIREVVSASSKLACGAGGTIATHNKLGVGTKIDLRKQKDGDETGKKKIITL
jgi:hypothetical protein